MMIGTWLNWRTDLADLPTVHFRHHKIQNHQVRLQLTDHAQPFGAVIGSKDLKSLRL